MGKRSGSKRKDKNKVILPPELPPDVDIQLTEDDYNYYGGKENYAARFHQFDQKVIDRLVCRLATAPLRCAFLFLASLWLLRRFD